MEKNGGISYGMCMKTMLLVAGLLAAVALPATAAQPKLLGTFQQWDAFSSGQGKAMVCYAITVPTHAKPVDVSHGAVYMMVSHKPAKQIRDEVRFGFGYALKPGSDVVASIASMKETLFVSGNDAWAYDAKGDARVVAAMKGGQSMMVKALSAKGNNTAYEYPLSGFSAAYNAAANACGVK